MTQDEIIEMARQAGFDFLNGWRDWGESCEYGEAWPEQIEAFAKLVAAKEREACAKVCDEIEWRFKELLDKFLYELDAGGVNGAQQCSQKIRARGEA